ncbi:EEF1A lysine methyltransferase 2-like [Lineus longissimus]|uniref:EEF1A lysine methyltransferase 2-like n=1 Tax=Lineus longissimus TaxID=88925 RepID=UPI002B4E0C9B
MSDETDLVPSQLGTKEYWDGAYSTELKNFKELGDVGEVWFGEETLARMVRWLEKSEIPRDSSILDVGCGNGMFLVELAKEGFTNLTGVDYSMGAIELAKLVSIGEKVDINYEQADLLEDLWDTSTASLKRHYDVCADKGTYDAVCLNPDDAKQRRNIYIKNIHQLLNSNGYFIITSCNWTEDELRWHFSEGFSVHKVIPIPKFTFGGKQGQTTTTIIFHKTS